MVLKRESVRGNASELCHINTHRLQDTMHCFLSEREREGVKNCCFSRLACEAQEEKEDLPLVFSPGLFLEVSEQQWTVRTTLLE